MLFFTFFFFNDTATTEIYTLSLHDALPISKSRPTPASPQVRTGVMGVRRFVTAKGAATANPTIPPTKAPLRSSGASHRSLVKTTTAAPTPNRPPTPAPAKSPGFPAALPRMEPTTAPRPANTQVARNTGMGFKGSRLVLEGRVFA